jgi:3-hydroxyacyl-CoA dehydrogenase
VTSTDSISCQIKDGVLEITLLRHHGALLGRAQRQALIDALAQPAGEAQAVLIRSADGSLARHPDLGPDLPDPDDTRTPTLADLCRAVERSALPVGILIDGAVAGVGAELALAATRRLASPRARIGFPAVRVGRINGAGGTQRLASLVGAGAALRLLTTGGLVTAAEALVIGLVDEVLDPDAPDTLGQAARHALRARPRQPATARAVDGRAFLQAVQAARQLAPPDSAKAGLIDCVEAALLLPRDQGHAFEAAVAIARDLLPETAALSHQVRAMRRAAMTPDALARVEAAAIARPALVGADPGLAGAVLMMLSRGLPVLVHEPDRDRLVALLQAVAARQEAAVQAGRLSAAQRDADWARLTPVSDAAGLAQADLVIVARDRDVPMVRSAVTVLVMGRADLPPNGFRLVLARRVAELGLPPHCPARPAAQALAFLRRIGLIVVLTGTQSAVGISGRLAGAGAAALRAIVDLGVAPGEILTALEQFGVTAANVPQTELVASRREMEPDQIIDRWLGALANEGARVLASGLAIAASDIDLVAVQALGLPERCGGPLHIADRRGLLILRRDLQLWATEAEVWTPVPALDAFVSVGRGFAAGDRVSPG